MPELVVLAHNIRSVYNVGSIFRTCEGFGVSRLIFSGYTPYPRVEGDSRLPHISSKITTQIAKTALGAENIVPFERSENVFNAIKRYKSQNYTILGLEQCPDSVKLQDFVPIPKIVLILGEEVNGIPPEVLKLCDKTLEIPMFGQKESFNVSVAAGIALYQLACK
ncbi:MAG: TrmH family RNA methyltransferase [Candidatus Nomurabacteria bacterium]|jgi:tRNA G18 (ribose-2'-O)-methylase SpoU|nr:TrmH family RNA methyltransferase [Candidatus Nomurabacteria bacterium]